MVQKMKITAVVVTYNRIEKLKKVIEAIRGQSTSLFQIIVVNNSSTDGTREWLENQSDITLVNQGNLGGAGGFNTGMKQAVLNGADFVWVMDDDVYPEKDAVHYLYNGLFPRTELGFACSTVVDPKGNMVNTPDISSKLNEASYKEWHKELSKGLVYLDACTFVSVLFSKDVIFEVGLPIKEYFIWGDDTEYTLRLSRKYQKPGLLVANSRVIHDRVFSASPSLLTERDRNRLNMYFYMIRNHVHISKVYRKGFLRDGLRLFLQLSFGIFTSNDKKLARAFILIRAFFASIFFNPTIERINKI